MRFPDMILRCMFYIELLFYTIPFLWTVKRRGLFPLRAVCAAALWLSPPFLWHFAENNSFVLHIVQDVLLFILLNVLILLCFQCPVKMALYCATGAYAFQQIGLQINMTLQGGLPFFRGFSIPALLLYLLPAALLFFLGWWFFTRLLRKNGEKYIENRFIFIISIFLVGTLSVFNAANSLWLYGIPAQVNYVFRLFIVCCCLLTLWQEYSFYQLDRAREEIAVIQQLRYREQKQMEQLQETTNLINIKSHDMRHLLSLIKNKSDASVEKEIKGINDLIDIYDMEVDTGNPTLNLVLAEKSLLCQGEHIRMNCIADGNCLSFMDEVDIFSLFGNALDNAIHAVRKLEDPDDRIISLYISKKAELAAVRVENYFSGDLVLADGMPVTEQEDTQYHGYGMRSMKLISEKYHGSMQISTDQNIFKLSFLLSPSA